MPSPKRSLTLTDLAEIDFESILQYTLEQWGMRQMDIYEGMLMDALHRLQNSPEIGYSVSLNDSIYKAFRIGKHVIFYRASADTLLVLRILHERMDRARHFLH
jgi:toxin ParE1/3/4